LNKARNGISSWTISPARPGSKPATQVDELGMLLQTKFHYPKRSEKKGNKKENHQQNLPKTTVNFYSDH
jgi:hypothetical protein